MECFFLSISVKIYFMQCSFLIFSNFVRYSNKHTTANLLTEGRSTRNGKGTGVKFDAREDTRLTENPFLCFGPPLPSGGHMKNKQSLSSFCQKFEKTGQLPSFIKEDKNLLKSLQGQLCIPKKIFTLHAFLGPPNLESLSVDKKFIILSALIFLHF